MTRMRHLLATTLTLMLLMPASALAGPVREYQLQYEPSGDASGALMIVSALVDPQLTLPVTIAVPVPRGSTLLWAGEIVGDDPEQDPSRSATVEQVGDMDVYTLTVEQSYTAQLELRVPGPTASGKKISGSVAWTNPGDAVAVSGAVILEAGAEDVKTEPELMGTVQTNDAGESLYPLAGVQLGTGETYGISVEWTRTGSGSTGGVGTTSASPVLPVALLALVIAVVALVVVLARERTRARRSTASPSPVQQRVVEDRDAGDELTWP